MFVDRANTLQKAYRTSIGHSYTSIIQDTTCRRTCRSKNRKNKGDMSSSRQDVGPQFVVQ
jgi:hypothetical protein